MRRGYNQQVAPPLDCGTHYCCLECRVITPAQLFYRSYRHFRVRSIILLFQGDRVTQAVQLCAATSKLAGSDLGKNVGSMRGDNSHLG